MSENKKELTLPEIQQEALKVLIKFDSLCREHNWSYFITYGTLLGAVRHKGFIPWDDDVDVQMPREDFDAFSKWCNENAEQIKPFKLCSRETVQNYPFGISRFANMDFRYVTTSERYLDFDIGVFLDIYPFDNYGSSLNVGRKIQKKISRINFNVRVFLSGSAAKKGLVSAVKKTMHHILRLVKPDDYPVNANKEILGLIKKYTNDSDIYVGCPSWTAGCYQYKKEWFAEKSELEFEGHLFPVPAGYDAFLAFMYGDYMQLPPEEKRVPYHEYKIYPRNS